MNASHDGRPAILNIATLALMPLAVLAGTQLPGVIGVPIIVACVCLFTVAVINLFGPAGG